MRHDAGIESTAAFLHHPLHPLMVPLPISAFLAALCTDFVSLFTADPFWPMAAYWCLIAGIGAGLLAGIVGAVDFVSLPGVRSLAAAQAHAIGNIGVLSLACLNLALRWHQPTHVAGWHFIFSGATVGLLAITGWLGGSLAYKHRIGQIAPEHGGVNLARAPSE